MIKLKNKPGTKGQVDCVRILLMGLKLREKDIQAKLPRGARFSASISLGKDNHPFVLIRVSRKTLKSPRNKLPQMLSLRAWGLIKGKYSVRLPVHLQKYTRSARSLSIGVAV
jgi:hypothetical protein